MIVAVDPGKITGVATWHDSAVSAWQDDWFPALVRIEDAIHNGLPMDALVCESYTITASTLRKTRQPWSLEAIGVLRYLARRNGIHFPDPQSPADAKRFITDEKLHAMGWYTPTTGGHANDAARHLALYISRADPKLFTRLLAMS